MTAKLCYRTLHNGSCHRDAGHDGECSIYSDFPPESAEAPLDWCGEPFGDKDGEVHYCDEIKPCPIHARESQGAEKLLDEVRHSYEKLPEAPWFKHVYEGASMGETIPVEGEQGAERAQLIEYAAIAVGPSRPWVEERAPGATEGSWPADDIRRAFVQGAKWWEFYSTGATMWASDQDVAEDEAERRYPAGTRGVSAFDHKGGR